MGNYSEASHQKETINERRSHPRFQVKTGAFAMFGDHPVVLGQIIDISEGGLSFRYVSNEPLTEDLFQLDILRTDGTFTIHGLPFFTVRDFGMFGDLSVGFSTFRRCGVKFEDLSNNQSFDLRCFLRTQTTHDTDSANMKF